MLLDGKVALITGGTRGIGAQIAKIFAENGAKIAVCDIRVPSEEEIKQNLPEGTLCYKCDVSNSEDCKETVKKINDDLGIIDILVNNAGITADNLAVSMSDDEFDRVINVNLKGCFNMTKACSRGFLKKKAGKIINMASISALKGLAGQANYASSKAGIIALTKVISRELGKRGVCANAIAPGYIQTDMTKDLAVADDYMKQIPLNRAGQPRDVAKVALFLASDLSDYVTGETIRVDGGLAI